MIAQKKTETIGGVDTPVLKVLASNGTRTWVGTEDALNAAIANGEIQPGTVADTYVEAADPLNIDFATKKYCFDQNKLSTFTRVVNQTIAAGSSDAYTDPYECTYDGMMNCAIFKNSGTGTDNTAIEILYPGDTVWTVFMAFGNISGNTYFGSFPVVKGCKVRVPFKFRSGSNSWTVYLFVGYYTSRDYTFN